LKTLWKVVFLIGILCLVISCSGGPFIGVSPTIEAQLPSATLEPTHTPIEETVSTPTAFAPTAASVSATSTSQENIVFSPIIFKPQGGRVSFMLLGGMQPGGWSDADRAAARMTGDERYTLYTPAGLAGGIDGALPVQDRICKSYSISLDSSVMDGSLVGVTGNWAVTPRLAQELPVDTAVYLQTVAEWLTDQAPSQPIPVISRIWRVDVEGDGTDETFISASRFAEPSGHNVEPRDYSVILMRKVVGDSVVTVPLVGEYYNEYAENRFPMSYSLEFIGDLNGDGRLEVVVGIKRWEGEGAIVYEIDGIKTFQVLKVICVM
jgi:hypothetical protein